MSEQAPVHGRQPLGGLVAALERFPRFGPEVTPCPAKRVLALDGLRGWAALSVLCFHASWETFGNIQPIYRNPITASLLDGSLAVAIFFVLSGEALSASYFAGRGPRAVIELAVKRYPRLVIPILAASTLTTLLVGLDLCPNQAAGQIVERPNWIGAFLTQPVGVGRLFRFSLFDVFTNIDPRESLMPFLWSMRIELIGSILTFLILLVCDRRRIGWLIFGTMFGALMLAYASNIQTCGNLACFLVGLCLAKMRSSGMFERAHGAAAITWSASATALILMAADGIIHAKGLFPAHGPASAMLLVPLLSCSKSAERFLGNGLSRFLGLISFPLFLVQFPVIISFTSTMIVYVGRDGVDHLSFFIALASVAATMAVAVLFRPIEDVTRATCNFLAGFLPWRIQQKGL